MGKVVLSSEDEMEGVRETEARQARTRHKKKNKGDGGGGGGAAAGTSSSSSVVEWARFLPKMVLRVLLVEADDSTRQIIAALLRKCCYRVTAVSDGLKAWEVLKGSPENVDLILTEVELPSISGYALLTLIMEHDACKNIPVIMMSSQDSISTVYKCMLRGAADFLVKPVRKNELKNLWQHFWRKQASSSAGNELPDESVTQQKVEATAENKANSNHSSGFVACILRNRECIDKGSDAQSSCTKPESDAEKTDIEHGHCPPQTMNQLSNDLNTPKHEECHRRSSKTRRHDNEVGGNVLAGMEQDNVNVQTSENNPVLENFSSEAIDLIGAFDNYGKGIFGSSASNVSAIKCDSLSHLDLSLTRVNPSGPVNQVNGEHRLNHSDASAFYRYIGKQLHLAARTCDQQKDQQPDSDSKLSNHISQTNEKSLPIQVKGIRFENVIRASDFVMPSPGTSNHSESFRRMNQLHQTSNSPSSSEQINNLTDKKPDNVIDQGDSKQAQKLEIRGDREDLCPEENDQSANSRLRAGNMSHHPINEGSAFKAASEHDNEGGFNVHEGSSHRSLQREEALKKFRLKRKERCFEKKVRYESRKKLAEQRPRVKGQFVRQVPTDDPQHGNS